MLQTLSKKLLQCRNVFQKIQLRTNKVQTVEIFINGKSETVPAFYTIMQALRSKGVIIPNFCYHDRLSISGNCRMCLVHIEGWMKPQIACAVGVGKGMKIRTNSPETYKAQEGVLEFILVDHPLDCPICDQGGECDLQDITVRYGNDRSRFTDIHFEGKRAVENKNLSTLIRAEMTRCIHCTRCIRFGSQVCGIDVLGTTGRGTDMLVGTYVEKLFLSELSGNIVDLCPVGALTARPYMFKARNWELKKTKSIDVTDATGTNITINYRFDRVLRILPQEHEDINQEWLSDKGRWAIDSLEMQRLVTPMIRTGDCCCPVEWPHALAAARDLICCTQSHEIMAVAGPHTCVETLVACKDFLNMLDCENLYIEQPLLNIISGGDLKTAYCINVTMRDIEQADKILLIGTNPRFEAPVLNAWIRRAFTHNECDIFVIGPKCEYNYHVTYVGTKIEDISKAGSKLTGAKKPLIFVGVTQLGIEGSGLLMSEVYKLADSLKVKDWGIVNVLTKEASFAGALEAGYKPGALAFMKSCSPKLVISLGADNIFGEWAPPSDCRVIYIGFQGDKGAECASVILPGCAYTEGGGIYLNMEGRSQFALPAVTPPGKARHDWKIIRALAECCYCCLYYTNHASLCTRMAQISPNFQYVGAYQPKLFTEQAAKLVEPAAGTGTIDVKMKEMQDYYCNDVFTFNSPTMVKAKKSAAKFKNHLYSAQ